MATYVPNATQTTEPLESQTVESAALEFRTLKTSVNSRLATEITDRTNADTNLQGQITSLTGAIVGGAVAAIVTSQEIVGDGVTATYTLSAAVDSSLHVDLYIDGAHQQPSSYTVVLDQLTLSEVPHAGALMAVKIGKPIGVGTTDASLVQYEPAGTGAVPMAVQAKLRESVSVFDFMTVAQIANVLDGITDTTLTATINAAIVWCDATGRNLHFPSGQYSIDMLDVIDTEYNFSMSCDGAIFHGIATTARAGMINIINAVDFDMTGKWRLHADGNANYTAAFSLKARVGGIVQVVTRVNIYGLMCYNALQAVHIGDFDNDSQCSEINFFGHDAFVCPIDVYLGGSNTLASFNGCNLISEPSPNFPGAIEAVVNNEGGVVSVNGGEFVIALSSGYGILMSPASSATYSNPYGTIRLNGTHTEVSSQFLHIENLRALAAPASSGSTVTVIGCGGYVSPAVGAIDYMSVVDTAYAGHIMLQSNSIYSTVARTGYNISSVSPLLRVTCDKLSFGLNFKNWLAGINGGQVIHDLQPVVNAYGIGATITGPTTLKFTNNDVSGIMLRYGTTYNVVTGVYTAAYNFVRLVIDVTIVGTGVAADLFLKRNGNIVAFGSYNAVNGVGKLNATLWNVAIGTTIEVVLQPVSPATFDGAIHQSLQITGDTN